MNDPDGRSKKMPYPPRNVVLPFLNGAQENPTLGAKLSRSWPLRVCLLSALAIVGSELSIAAIPVVAALLGSKKPPRRSSGLDSSDGSKLAKRPFFSVGQPNQSQRKPRLSVKGLLIRQSSLRYRLRSLNRKDLSVMPK